MANNLNYLSQYKKAVLKNEYKIDNLYTVQHSINNQSKINYGYIIVPDKQYYNEIINNLKEQVDKGKPVLIFFDNFYDIVNFWNLTGFNEYKEQTILLTNRQSFGDARSRAIRMMCKNKISLMTKEMARDLDFLTYQ